MSLCLKWFGKSKLKQSDGVFCLRGANGKPLQEYGKRQICLRIGGKTKRYDFHVVDVTKPILSVSYLCEHGIATHLAEHPFLRFGDEREPLIRKGGVYFVKAQTVNAVETMIQDEPEKRCVRAEYSQSRCVRAENSQTDADELKIRKIQKRDAYELKIHKIGAHELKIHKIHKKRCARKLKIHKSHPYELMDGRELMDARKLKIHEVIRTS